MKRFVYFFKELLFTENVQLSAGYLPIIGLQYTEHTLTPPPPPGKEMPMVSPPKPGQGKMPVRKVNKPKLKIRNYAKNG